MLRVIILGKQLSIIDWFPAIMLHCSVNKRPMGPVSLTRFLLQNYLKHFAISGTLF